MNNQSTQTITFPTEEDLKILEAQRSVCTQYLGDENSKAKYHSSSAGKLGLLRALLAANIFSADQTYELQAMGVILGDVFVKELGMQWIMVEDDYGRNPALQMPGTSIILYPQTMISKRVEKGDSVDVFDLFNGLADEVDRLRMEQQSDSR